MDFNIPRIPVITPPEISVARADYANVYHERLMSAIGDFEQQLDDEHEVAIRLVSFGQTVTFHVVGIGYRNPKLIVFHGIAEGGNRLELIQHVSQISFLLMAEPKLKADEAPRRIGFNPESGSEANA